MAETKIEPWFVTEQRTRKAGAIARHLVAEGVSAIDAARYDDTQRLAVAQVVDKPKPSARTWRLVVEMLAGSHAVDALCPTCGIGDPEGVPGPRKTYMHDGPCSR